VRLDVQPQSAASHREILLDMSRIDTREADAQLFRKIGILGPWTRPVLGEVMAGSAAERAGLRQGDVVLRLGATDVVDGQQLRELIRQSVRGAEALAQPWRIERSGRVLTLDVLPEAKVGLGATVGRIGAYVGA
ncbi:PDZ domain-containing protein, partial [Escherichia coli]|uniref:PDZ domain-containing protein n=1 Tax=Escherichia coli TaxID=562 RepID=UPI00201D50C2